jgi:hypothetical protein
MPDEIDLLRAFRADTPGPDDAAWERARAAVALAEGAATPDPRSRRRRPRAIRGLRRDRVTRGRGILAAAMVIVVGIAAGVLATVLQGPPSLNAPVTTAWQPARPLPSGSGGITAPAGTWHLMGYLVAKGWQENTTGPEPGPLTCPTAATCYVEGNNSKSPSGPSDMNSFYTSTDGAQTWSVLPVPDGVTFTSALSCASATDCGAGGLYYGHQPIYLTTTTGGHSWTARPLPDDVGQILRLDCVTATTCRGLASVSGKSISPGLRMLMPDLRFVVTSDGGRHFTVGPFPRGESIQSVSCPTPSHCVAVGLYTKLGSGKAPNLDHGVLLTSDDGGATWRQRAWPNGFGPGPFPDDVTCVDASHCAMIGFIERNGTVRDQVGAVMSGKDAVQYTVIGFSSNGGETWTTSTLPRSMPYPMIDALTCPTTTTCYAAGSDLIAQHIGNTYNAGSSVVAITHNAGRTWQRVAFAVPAQVPGGMQGDSFGDIGQIECPQADACVAMGVSDQGSTSTPIYTSHG